MAYLLSHRQTSMGRPKKAAGRKPLAKKDTNVPVQFEANPSDMKEDFQAPESSEDLEEQTRAIKLVCDALRQEGDLYMLAARYFSKLENHEVLQHFLFPLRGFLGDCTGLVKGSLHINLQKSCSPEYVVTKFKSVVPARLPTCFFFIPFSLSSFSQAWFPST